MVKRQRTEFTIFGRKRGCLDRISAQPTVILSLVTGFLDWFSICHFSNCSTSLRKTPDRVAAGDGWGVGRIINPRDDYKLADRLRVDMLFIPKPMAHLVLSGLSYTIPVQVPTICMLLYEHILHHRDVTLAKGVTRADVSDFMLLVLGAQSNYKGDVETYDITASMFDEQVTVELLQYLFGRYSVELDSNHLWACFACVGKHAPLVLPVLRKAAYADIVATRRCLIEDGIAAWSDEKTKRMTSLSAKLIADPSSPGVLGWLYRCGEQPNWGDLLTHVCETSTGVVIRLFLDVFVRGPKFTAMAYSNLTSAADDPDISTFRRIELHKIKLEYFPL